MHPEFISRDFDGRRNELWQAAFEVDHAQVKLLLDRNHADPQSDHNYVNQTADVNATRYDGNSLLHSRGVNKWILERFLRAGADINTLNATGRTPLLKLAHEYLEILGSTNNIHPPNIAHHQNEILDSISNDANGDIKDRSNRTAEDNVFECRRPKIYNDSSIRRLCWGCRLDKSALVQGGL